MSIKQLVLFGVLGTVVVATIVFLYTSIRSDSKDTKPVVTYEQLDNKLKSIQSDNESGSLKLEEKQKELSAIEAERAELEKRLR